MIFLFFTGSLESVGVGHKVSFIDVVQCLQFIHVVRPFITFNGRMDVVFILIEKSEDFVGKNNKLMLLWLFLRVICINIRLG